ncbi:LysM peptidoglycan-binding domain-containing protein [[Clostridium] colinum]|uniref:LysM peptidoglycan-binding domain-containing protein n=1 Tax=[Clostridium] colinum TaxID=36835 RepID=UPI0020240D8D|nr:LysM peptidoglycan-binding domain-containing protein [[Clostridium] colinum]
MIIYVVKEGDTLSSIAKNYDTTAEFLAKENMINLSDNLVIGQTIVIPQNTKKIGTIATNGYLYTNIEEDLLRQTLPYLTFATVFSYGFKENGELIPANDENVLNIIKEYDTKPIMLLSPLNENGNFDNQLASKILNDVEIQNILIYNILKTLKEKDYFGLDIDFEFVLPQDSMSFVSFINNVTSSLNKQGYPVTVSLAPKTSSTQKGLLYEAHNYSAIGNIANAVLLMTYEWGYTLSHTR